MTRKMLPSELKGKTINYIVEDGDDLLLSLSNGSTVKIPTKDFNAEIEDPEHLCNLCGQSCLLTKNPHWGLDFGGLIDAHVNGGYHSTAGNGYGALDDCTTYSFSLCEFCLDWLFTKFQIPPAVSDYDGSEEKFKPAIERIKNYSGEWPQFFIKESERRANERKK